jgi:hypothetical protein
VLHRYERPPFAPFACTAYSATIYFGAHLLHHVEVSCCKTVPSVVYVIGQLVPASSRHRAGRHRVTVPQRNTFNQRWGRCAHACRSPFIRHTFRGRSSGCCIPRVPASSVRSFPDPSAHQAHKNEDHDEARFNFSHDADSVPNGFARSTTVRSHSQTKKWVRIFVCPTSIFRFALRIN